jgi:hypothetical protein
VGGLNRVASERRVPVLRPVGIGVKGMPVRNQKSNSGCRRDSRLAEDRDGQQELSSLINNINSLGDELTGSRHRTGRDTRDTS